jgi:hypothetical protein
MTREEANKLWPIIKAYANGEELQISEDGGGTWNAVCSMPTVTDKHMLYRAKKKISMGYVDFDEITDLWIRDICEPFNHFKVLFISPEYIEINNDKFYFGKIYNMIEWSTDRINWKPLMKDAIDDLNI